MPNFGPLNAGMASDPMPPGMASGPPNGPNGPPIGAKGAMGGTPGIGASPGKLGKDEVTIGSIGVIGSIGGAFTSWIWVVAPHPKLSDAFTASTAAKGNSWGPNCTKKSKARSTSGTGIGADNTCAASSVAVSWKSTWRRITWEQAVSECFISLGLFSGGKMPKHSVIVLLSLTQKNLELPHGRHLTF